MPISPSTWVAGSAVTASELNKDLYTFTPGNSLAPNGILFHSNPPMLESALWNATILGTQPSSSGGTSKSLWSLGQWRAVVDTSALFGPGADKYGTGGGGQFLPAVGGSAGASGSVGGAYLAFGTTSIAHTTNAGGTGSLLYYGAGATAGPVGVYQRSSTTRDNSAYVMDLVVATPPSFISLGGYCADASAGSYAYQVGATDFTGEACLFGAIWAGFDQSVNSTIASSLPVPTTGYASNSLITAAGMNGNGVAQPLTFLNNKPLLRASTALATTIAASGTSTILPITNATGDFDNWGGWNQTTHAYTVPVSGVYLVHCIANFPAVSGNSVGVGIRVNGSAEFYSPTYDGAGSGFTRPAMTRLVDLNAGDTVQMLAYQASGSTVNLNNTITSRMIIVWMAALAGSNGSVSWTPPDTGFRWQAGTPGSQLPALFQAHLANDLSFLIQRPYLMTWQSTQQTGLAQNAVQVITMNNVTGIVNGSAGDNYGGWTSGSANKYAAVRPGWYLAVLSVGQSVPGATAQCRAAIGYYTAGGVAQGTSAQRYGQQVQALSTGAFEQGADAIGLFYLRTGDYLQPQYMQQDGGATFSTDVLGGSQSHFGVVWVSE